MRTRLTRTSLLMAAVLAVPVIYQIQHADRIYDGVQVADIVLDGLTLDEATRAIHDRFTPYPGAPVTIRHEARTWTLSPADLGVSVDARATAAEAYAVGRRGSTSGDLLASLLGDLDEQWRTRSFGHSVAPVLKLDENRLAIVMKQIARDRVNGIMTDASRVLAIWAVIALPEGRKRRLSNG